VPAAIDERIRAVVAAAGVAGPVTVTDHPRSGRNRLYDVTGDGRAWIAKQSASPTESWFARTVAPGVGWVPPSLVAGADLVLSERAEGLPTALELAGRDRVAALEALADLAMPLAELHAWPTGDDVPASAAAIPQLDPVHVGVLVDSTEAARELLRRFHRRDALRDAMRVTRNSPGPTGLIHGDLKADNVLCAPGSPTIIDWELCGIGPFAWDLGSVVGSMLAMWIETADLTAPRPRDWLDRATLPYAAVVRAARRFVSDYERAASAPVPRPATTAAAAAAWLVARSWAESLQTMRVDPRLLLRLVVAEAVTLHPERLLGSPGAEGRR
jgi:hypothetical protein